VPQPALANGRHGREIIVGVDGSGASDAAVRWAVRKSIISGAALKLVHIVAAPLVTQTLQPVTMSIERSDERARRIVGDAADMVHRLAVGAGASVPTVSSEIYYSAAVPTLIELSRDAEVVVLGTRGHGPLRRGLSSSVSTALLHHAHCPVAVVHDNAEPPADAPVVVGINCSPHSVVRLATRIAYKEAAQRRVGLIAVHEWSDSNLFAVPGVNWPALRDEYPAVRVRRVILPEQSARNLAQVAENAQLLVVGSDARGGVSALLPGSLGATLAHCVAIPLIVARQTPPGADLRRRAERLGRARRASLS
jgi:nucleotide-binding universal stress UspA family protein